MEFSYFMPVRLLFGANVIDQLGATAKSYGTHALIVTGRSSTKRSGLLDRSIALLEAAGVRATVFNKVEPNPLTREQGCDLVIGMGGGSMMDAAKAVAFCAVNGGDVNDYISGGKQGTGCLPILEVPTTCGTGSEANPFAVLTNLVNVLPIEQDEKVTAMIHLREFPEDRYLVMVTRSGTVKRIQLSSIYTARKAGIRCITLDEGDELICVRETDGDQAILIVTHDGMAICFKETDVRCMGRDAAGVRGINLRPGDYVVGAARAKRDHQVLMITENGYGKRTDMDEYIRADGPQKRGGFGLKGYNITEKTGPVVGVKVVSDGDDVLVINDAGVIIRMAAAGISTYGRTAQGVKIMNLEEGVKVISFARTDHEEEEEAAEGETPAGGPEQA